MLNSDAPQKPQTEVAVFTATHHHLMHALTACDGDMERMMSRLMALASTPRDLKAVQYAQGYYQANPKR